MSGLDLPEIRARLAAKDKTRRRGGYGPLRSLKALLSDEPLPPLLGRPEPPPMGPLRRPASAELDLLDAAAEPPLLTEQRRSTFGLRGESDDGPGDTPLLLESPHAVVEDEPLLLDEPLAPGLSPAEFDLSPSAAALALLGRLETRLAQEQALLTGRIVQAGRC